MIFPAQGWIAPILAFAAAALALVVLRRFAARLPQAAPNARSLHERVVPRAGGYAIWAGFLPVALVAPPAFPHDLGGWLPAWAALVLVSAIDDARGVGVVPRLAIHAAAALWAAVALVAPGDESAIAPLASIAEVALVALVIAWSSNLYNFMDGSDGLAALMAVVGFCAYGVASALGDRPQPAWWALAASTLAFLFVNRPRAGMFMGDVGSVPIGFLAAAFGVAGALDGLWPAWFPALVFLPFLADATATLALRIARRERFWQAHRSHYYQRLAQLGAGHAGVLTAYGAIMLGTATSAVVCLELAPGRGVSLLVGWCVVMLILFATIDYHWRRRTPDPR